MKEYKIFNIFILIIAIIMMTSILLFLVMAIGTQIQEGLGMNHHWTEKGDCFDRDWNKINEVTCDIKKSCSENWISILGKCEGGEVLK